MLPRTNPIYDYQKNKHITGMVHRLKPHYRELIILRYLDEMSYAEISKKLNKTPKAGVFGADMLVKIENDGPVTIFMDSKNKSF